MTAVLRVGLVLLTMVELTLGLWTSIAPQRFYDDVPTVSLTPPFSEHLFRDFGGATLGLAVVLGAAAIWPQTRLVVVALLAYLAFATPHLAFHLGHLHGATQLQAVVLVVNLIASVLGPVLLLFIAAARHRRASASYAG